MTQTLPSGALVFLFTFIEDVARLWEEHSVELGSAVHRHQKIVRECIAQNDGREVKSPGDSFLVVCQSPRKSLRCACAIHAALAGQRESEEVLRRVGGIRVRIGAHLGEAVLRSGDYYNPAVNRAARIADAGHGGMTIVSGTLRDAAGSADEDDGISFEDCGLHRLKDLGSPVRLYLVCHPTCPPAPQRMLRTLEGILHNIPPLETRFARRRCPSFFEAARG